MKRRYLEVTFRGGKPLAAYLYLPRKRGSRVASTRDAGHGLRVDWVFVGGTTGESVARSEWGGTVAL